MAGESLRGLKVDDRIMGFLVGLLVGIDTMLVFLVYLK